ncbi:MAG: radical SAM family heme chaperone HemW [Pirellulales bacterium]
MAPHAPVVHEATQPRAAYVHVPFCRHRCGYCNFTLVAGRDDLIGDYLRAIELELATLGQPREVDTLFFGGGTPTHLSPDQWRQLAATARRWFPLAPGYEFSVEANPADLNDEMLSALAESGVNRVSIGGQSFDAVKLKLLERDHTAEQLRAAITTAQPRFPSVSLDLIFGVPSETTAIWSNDLQHGLALRPAHVSTYGLTFERGTAFWKRLLEGELGRLDEELERSLYGTAIDTLTAAGYEHYEVSNFALPGYRCRHNETYWSGDAYFAAGPGAARYIAGRREMNHRSTTTWLKRVLAGQSPVAESESLDSEARARELLVFALRRLEGVDRRAFAARSGFEVDQLVAEPLRRFVELGLLEDDGQRVRLSREGLFVSDAIWPHFLR